MKKSKTHRRMCLFFALLLTISLIPVAGMAAVEEVTLNTPSQMTRLWIYESTDGRDTLQGPYHQVASGPDAGQVAYCLQHRKLSPNGNAHTVELLFDRYSEKTALGIQAILENGYDGSSDVIRDDEGNILTSTKSQSHYGTLNAIRMWLSEQPETQADLYGFTNLSQYSTDAQLDALVAQGNVPGQLYPQGEDGQAAFRLAIYLLKKARHQEVKPHTLSFSQNVVNAKQDGDYFTASVKLQLTGVDQASISASGLPTGATVKDSSGFNSIGRTYTSGTTLTVRIPLQGNTGKTITLNASGVYSGPSRSTLVVAIPSDSARQRSVYFKKSDTTITPASVTISTPSMGRISILKKGSQEKTPGVKTEDEVVLPNVIFKIRDKQTGVLVDTLKTDANGMATSKWLECKTYTVSEETVPGYTSVEPFDVVITENARTYSYELVNKIISRKIRVVKKDAETGVQIPLSIQFKITDTNNVPIIFDGDKEVLSTDKNGCCDLPQELVDGNYLLHEVESGEGYLLSKYPVPFAVNTNSPETVEVSVSDYPAKGIIKIKKTGLTFTGAEKQETGFGEIYTPIFEEKTLEGVTIKITAAEDIIVGGQLKYRAGDVVDTFKTYETESKNHSRELYLGKYIVTEQGAEGYWPDDTKHEVTLSYEGQETSVVMATVPIYNERIRQKAELYKVREVLNGSEGETPVYEYIPAEGVTFGLFTAHDISIGDTVVIPSDALVSLATTNDSGHAVFDALLPWGSYYAKELDIMTDGLVYDMSEEHYPLEFTTTSFDIIQLSSMEAPIKNDLKKYPVRLIKQDDSGTPLANALIEIRTVADGTLVYTGKTNDAGEIFVELPVNEYVYQELEQPEGFVLDKEEHFFTVKPDGTIEGELSLTNETVQVRIFKCDPKKTPLPGAVFGLFVKGELKMTAVSGDDGFVVFEGIPFQNQEFEIREIEAPEGYQVSGETIILKVDEEFENAKEPYVIVNVPNIKTGYDGSILPVILGCFGGTGLTAALIVFLCNKRRKKNA